MIETKRLNTGVEMSFMQASATKVLAPDYLGVYNFSRNRRRYERPL